ncbi:MAG TPA: hypothetical protein VM053_03465 [Gemmatimonadaceae bacterium]|nr:hypothetical protein [Gemmatimonadaceae bacterium]
MRAREGDRRGSSDLDPIPRRFSDRIQRPVRRGAEVTPAVSTMGAWRQRDHVTAAVFGSMLSIGLGLIYWLGRVGFSNPIRPIAITVGLALFVVCVPTAISVVGRGKTEVTEQPGIWRSVSLMVLGCFALTALAGILVYPTKINFGIPILVVGVAAFVFTLFFWLRNSRISSILLLISLAGLFTAWTAGIAWGTRYKTPLFWEQLSDKADVHHDPLYYASMANAMRSYGVPSTALDGVPYTPYHYGSAWLNAQWSDLAGVDVLTFYSLGPTVFIAPVFLFGLLLFASEARSVWRSGKPDTQLSELIQEDWLAVAALIGATIGFIPSTTMDAFSIWNRHLLISESYLTGLSVIMPCAALAVGWWFSRTERRRPRDLVFLLAVIPILLAGLGFLKVSLMLLTLAAFFWTLLRTRAHKDPVYLASALLALAASLVTFKLVSNPDQNQGLVPFSFMRYSADVRAWPWFILAHFFWSWVYIALRVYEEKLPTLSDVWDAIKTGRLLDAELVAVVAICGFLPGELITIHGGSAVYFSDVQRWVAAPLVIASATRILRQRREGFTGNRLTSMSLRTVAICVIAVPVAITVVLNVSRAVRGAVLQNAALRGNFYTYAGASPASLRAMTNPHMLAAGMQKAADYQLISTLRSLDAEPRELKGKTLLFVPQSDSAFWKIFAEADRCSYVPLVGPATSGMALLDGMPPSSCDLTDQYDMTVYSRRTLPQSPADVTPGSLCARAARKGFRRIVVLTFDGRGEYSTPAITCGAVE